MCSYYLVHVHGCMHCKKSGGHIPPNMFPTLGVMSHHDAGGGTLPLSGAAQVVRPVRPWPDQYSMGGIRHELICMVRIVN